MQTARTLPPKRVQAGCCQGPFRASAKPGSHVLQIALAHHAANKRESKVFSRPVGENAPERHTRGRDDGTYPEAERVARRGADDARGDGQKDIQGEEHDYHDNDGRSATSLLPHWRLSQRGRMESGSLQGTKQRWWPTRA